MTALRLPNFEASRAVLIGTARYSSNGITDLPQVENNLDDLRDLLTSQRSGFPEENVGLVRNPSNVAEVMGVVKTAAEYASDVLLVYYAGHGLLMGDQSDLHLSLTTSRIDEEWTALPFAYLAKIIKQSRAKAKVLVVDCCYSGRASRDLMADQSEIVNDQLRIDGIYIITATSPVKKAKAPDGSYHTAFTGTLIDVARDGVCSEQRLLGMSELFSEIGTRMREHRDWPKPQQANKGSAAHLALVRNAGYSLVAAPEEVVHALDFSRSRAVVIGTGHYENSQFNALPSSLNDAREMHNTLIDAKVFGFDDGRCTLVRDPDSPLAVARPLYEAALEAEDLLIVFASGHAMRDVDGDIYLATTTTDHKFLDCTALSGSVLAKILSLSRAESILVIIDGCFAGQFAAVLADRVRHATFIGATGPVQLARCDEEHGVFTRALLHQLRAGQQGGPVHLTAPELFASLSAEIDQAAAPPPVFSASHISKFGCLYKNRSWAPGQPGARRCPG